jgi:glutamine phosphoribosylpyrophosphate amidotransferase
MKWLYRFFATLGVIFFVLLLGLAYFVIADPYNLRPLIMGMYQKDAASLESSTPRTDALENNSVDEVATPQVTTPARMVNENQAKALESAGINPDSVPSQFTAAQIECFVGILGQARVDAIVDGDIPTPTEFFKAKNCL